jgi:acyl-CoA hydrolase
LITILGDHVFIHGAAATPRKLVPALAEHGKKANLKNVRIHHIHTEGAGEYNAPEFKGIFRSNSLFTGANCREPINSGRADFTPIFLGEIPKLFYRGIIKPDVALLHVTPADKHGFHSLGTSVDCARAAIQHSKFIVGQVNPRMPRTSGNFFSSFFVRNKTLNTLVFGLTLYKFEFNISYYY